MARTIESPGVEIREIDLSDVASLPVGTNVFVQGFADAGPTLELINVTSPSEMEKIYGVPTNAAERYFYHTCKQVLNSPGNLLTSRLPYGSGSGAGFGTNYTALLYPVSAAYYDASGNIQMKPLSSSDTMFANSSAFVIGTPEYITLSEETYLNWQAGVITWSASAGLAPTNASPGNAGFIIVNDAKTTIDDLFAGYYICIADNTGYGTTDFDSITSVQTVWSDDEFHTVSTTRLGFELTGTIAGAVDNLSENIENAPGFEFDNTEFNDDIILAVVKLRPSMYGQDTTTLYKVFAETPYVGSLNADRTRLSPMGGPPVNDFIANKINDKSPFIKMFVNNYLSKNAQWVVSGEHQGIVRNEARDAHAVGAYVPKSADSTNKVIGNVVTKLERSLRLAENTDDIPIDIICEGGLGTIWTAVKNSVATGDNAGFFTDSINLSGVHRDLNDPTDTDYLGHSTNGTSTDVQNNYETIYNMFANFVGATRRDCLYIADPLRYIFVQGDDFKILADNNRNFSLDIYWPMKNLYANAGPYSNYCCTYGNWVKAYDSASDKDIWLPMSGHVAGIMARMDANLQPWYAPAGLNNGLIPDILDIAVNPTQKQADLFYRVSVNPVKFSRGDGYVVWGQKTLQKKPSALDRINVRRLFLVLEKATLRLAKYFVFEPNTVFTRQRLVNILKPIFDIAKNNEGLYDYLIVCDERNNTPQTIDNNELIVDIYLKPVRTAEFILINFIATRTDQNFEELI